ncbi:MAG: selenocysteine-specific translation elongation factor [Chloroflexi bacterium]|nr:selenocysteine-specific translation elongation factor [Chloroflexota bacterium]
MFVLGTAGHVDHGKSALVKALTGIDPDRLQEEKERGMTIDLGFAWLKLPSGREISIVDVPGHERFIKNMLAGVGGIDLALLVVAADEGVMPQTREHLDILDLLQIKRGLVAITKVDLVDEDLIALVKDEVEELLKRTTLDNAPIVAVSSTTGEGIPHLLSTLELLLETVPPREDLGRPRLPIDRVFTMAGFGTVVTGTLIDGTFNIGQEVEVVPGSLRARIRGLQSHKQKMAAIGPGSRVAINLAGVATRELYRGQVVTTPGWLSAASTILDAKLHLISDAPHPLAHNTTVAFHTGASEVMAKVCLLEKERLNGGETSWAQLRLTEPVAVVKGDPFILRSPTYTLGGGTVVDPHPKRHRRFHSPTVASLFAKEEGTPEEIVLTLLTESQPQSLDNLSHRAHLPAAIVLTALNRLVSTQEIVSLGEKSPKAQFFSATGWEALTQRVKSTLGTYHRQHPLRGAMPKEELRSRLKLPQDWAAEAIQRWSQEEVIAETKTGVRLPSHRLQFSPLQQKMADAFLQALAQSPYSPPTHSLPDPEIVNALMEEGLVIRVSEEVVFASYAYEAMVKETTEHIKAHNKITVAEVRDLFHTSRKYALALMEHLDNQGVTRRRGDERVLV